LTHTQTTGTKQAGTTNDAPETFGVKDLATRLKIDARDLRKWLRSEGQGLGQKGKRYAFTKAEADKLAAAWRKSQKQTKETNS